MDNLSIVKLQADSIETDALINARCVEGNVSLNRIFHGTTENLAVGDVAIPPTDHSRNSFDAEAEIGSRSFNLDAICFLHQCLERLHTRSQFAIIQGADFEIKVFESLRAHSSKLSH